MNSFPRLLWLFGILFQYSINPQRCVGLSTLYRESGQTLNMNRLVYFLVSYFSFLSVALRLDGSEATFTISSGNLNSNTLRRAVDGDPSTCIWPRPAVSKASTVNLTFELFNCRAVATVEIMTGNSNIRYIPGVAIQEIDRCHGDRHFPRARCYAESLERVNPKKYRCPGKQARVVDIVVPANLPICEIEINHVPVPGIERILS